MTLESRFVECAVLCDYDCRTLQVATLEGLAVDGGNRFTGCHFAEAEDAGLVHEGVHGGEPA